MITDIILKSIALSLFTSAGAGLLAAETGLQWTERPSRNAATPAKNLPTTLAPENRLWELPLEGKSQFPIPTVIGDRVLVGTNQESLPDERLRTLNPDQTGGALICVDKQSGEVLWQILLPGIGSHPSYGWYGTVNTPVVEDNRIYINDPQGNIVCLDLHGLADGNDGSVTDEHIYMANTGFTLFERQDSKVTDQTLPEELDPEWGDVLWKTEILETFQLQWKHCHSGTGLIYGDYYYVPTSNSQHGSTKANAKAVNTGYSGKNLPEGWEPRHDQPNILVLDKMTGEVVGRDRVEVPHVYHGQWSSLSMGVVDGQPLIFFGDGFGVLHAFKPLPEGTQPGEELASLEHVWSFDAVPEEYRKAGYKAKTELKGFGNRNEGRPIPVVKDKLQANFIATPVFHNARVYAGLGRDFNYGAASGIFFCVDAATGEEIWRDDDVYTSMSTCGVADGKVYYADQKGYLYGWNAETGERLWKMDLEGSVHYSDVLVSENKLYVSTDGELWILQLTDTDGEPEVLNRVPATGAEPRTVGVDHGYLLHPSNRRLTAYSAEPVEGGPAATATAQVQKQPTAAIEGTAAIAPADAPWNGFGGPNGNHLSAAVPQHLADVSLVWKQPLNAMVYSGVVTDQERVYVMDHELGQRDIVRCYEALTGNLLWEQDWANPNTDMDWGSCARATPLLHNNRLYALGALGSLVCLNAETGDVLWQKDLQKDFGGVLPLWGYSASPVIVDGRLLVGPGGEEHSVVALDPATGRTLWSRPGAEANYGTFAAPKVDGRVQIVGYDQDDAFGLVLETGQEIWRKELPPNPGYVVSTPAFAGDQLLLGTSVSTFATPLGATGELPGSWPAMARSLRLGNNSPVVTNGLVLGVHKRGLTALDAEGLGVKWSIPEITCQDFAGIIANGDRALVLTDAGALYHISVAPDEGKILSQFAVTGHTLCAPAIYKNRLHIRDDNTLYAYKITAPQQEASIAR